MKLFLTPPFPCQVVLNVTETGLSKIRFSPNISCLVPRTTVLRAKFEAACLGVCYKGVGEAAVLRDEPVSQRYWLSTANVSTSTQCRSRGSGAALALLDSCCTDGWSLPSKYDAVRATQTYRMCSNFCVEIQQLGDPPGARVTN